MRKKTRQAIAGALLLALAVAFAGSATLAAGLPSGENAAASVKVVHWKTTITEKRGRAQVTWSNENWLKAENKWRSESSDNTLMIWNGPQRWEYTKQANKYTYRNDPKQECRYSRMEFLPDHIAAVELKKNSKATVAKTAVVQNGAKYACLEVREPASGLNGPRHTRMLAEPRSGLVKEKITQTFSLDGTMVVQEEHTEYDYSKQDIPDSFFIFQAPDGAKEANWGNGK